MRMIDADELATVLADFVAEGKADSPNDTDAFFRMIKEQPTVNAVVAEGKLFVAKNPVIKTWHRDGEVSIAGFYEKPYFRR